nr:DUF6516 family protein [Candidatus Freyarchaeota archaeon]
MSSDVLEEVARRAVNYKIVSHVEFLRTKVRVHLIGEYILDKYYNQTLGKYSYTLVKENKRIIGGDNAPHHLTVETYPDHFHMYNGTVRKSELSGNPLKDLNRVMKKVKNSSDYKTS